MPSTSSLNARGAADMALNGIWVPLYRSGAAGAAQASFTSERVLHTVAEMGPRPQIPANFVLPGGEREFSFRYWAQGVFSSTGTPTYTWTLRLGANASTSAAIIAGTAASTTGSGISNLAWRCEAEITFVTIADAGANSTVRGTGLLWTSGLATNPVPFNASASATAPTVATVDTSIANFFDLNITCSASSASNTITLLHEGVDFLQG